MTPSAASCVRVYKQSPAARLRLFCFPYAGASASAFQTLAFALPGEIEVCGIEYPGRGARAKERLTSNISEVVQEIAARLQAYFDKPFAFLGYSMGALICYELARHLSSSKRQPEHIFLAAAGAPRATTPGTLSRLSDDKFLAEVKKLNGIPSEVLADQELLGLALPVLRADFALCEAYRAREDAPLRCPVTVLAGQNDTHVPLGAIEAWSSYAGASISSRIFPGDHFFIRTAQPAVVQTLLDELRPLIESPSHSSETGSGSALRRQAPAGKRAALAQLLQAKLHSSNLYPLSLAQQALWIRQQLDPADPTQNVALVFQVRSELSLTALTRSLELLLERHPMLRTAFSESREGRPLQEPRARDTPKMRVHDLTEQAGNVRSQVLALSRKQASLAMALKQDPLYRFEVARASLSEFFFLATFHALILDRWSVFILQREIGAIYGALLRQAEPTLHPQRSTYRDFVQREQQRLQEKPTAARGEYWQRRLHDTPSVLDRLEDWPGNRPAHHGGGEVKIPQSAFSPGPSSLNASVVVPAERMRTLCQIADSQAVPLSTLMLTAFYVLLHGASDATDLAVAVTLPYREQPEFEHLLGPLARSIPVRADLSGDPGFLELLCRVHASAINDGRQAEIPLEQLPALRGIEKQPPFRIGFAFHDLPRSAATDGSSGAEAATLIIGANGFAKLDLLFDISNYLQGALILVEGNGKHFSTERVAPLLSEYASLLERIAANPRIRLQDAASSATKIGRRQAC